MTGHADVLATVALLGPIRRVGPVAWSATCPACRRDHALRVRRNVGGDLATCDTCGVLGVRAAIDRLDPPTEQQRPRRTMTTTATPTPPTASARRPPRPGSWSREAVIDALRRWTIDHGRAPYGADWEVASVAWPARRTVEKRFGSWAAALAAASLEPMPKRTGPVPIVTRLAELDARIARVEAALADATDADDRARVRRDAAALADAIRGGDQAS